MNNDINKEKWEFMINEYIMFSIQAAFQTRNHNFPVYKKKEEIPADILRNDPFKSIKNDINYLLRQYLNQISACGINEEDHLQEIQSIADQLSEKYAPVLHEGNFRIGISQKIINLFLKYMWAVNEIEEPCHCPIDGIVKHIIQHERQELRAKMEDVEFMELELCDWTKMDSIDEYLDYIKEIKFLANMKNITIAQWELLHWDRQNIGIKTIR